MHAFPDSHAALLVALGAAAVMLPAVVVAAAWAYAGWRGMRQTQRAASAFIGLHGATLDESRARMSATSVGVARDTDRLAAARVQLDQDLRQLRRVLALPGAALDDLREAVVAAVAPLPTAYAEPSSHAPGAAPPADEGAA